MTVEIFPMSCPNGSIRELASAFVDCTRFPREASAKFHVTRARREPAVRAVVASLSLQLDVSMTYVEHKGERRSYRTHRNVLARSLTAIPTLRSRCTSVSLYNRPAFLPTARFASSSTSTSSAAYITCGGLLSHPPRLPVRHSSRAWS